MRKIAIVNGNWLRDKQEPVKGCYTNGELQQRVAQFCQKFKVIDIQPFADTLIMIQYEE